MFVGGENECDVQVSESTVQTFSHDGNCFRFDSKMR